MKVDGRTAEDDNQARSTVTLDLERGHLGSILLCKVLHEGLHEELEARLEIDLNLPVETLEIDNSSLEGKEWTEMEVVCNE